MQAAGHEVRGLPCSQPLWTARAGTSSANHAKMGPFVAPRWLTALAATIAAIIVALNAKLVWDYVIG